MLPPKERMCHHTGFEKNCRQLVVDDACKRWCKVSGVPASGKDEDLWNCIDDHAHTLRLNILAAVNGGAAATESFRNLVASRVRPTPPAYQALEHKELAE